MCVSEVFSYVSCFRSLMSGRMRRLAMMLTAVVEGI